MNDNSNEFGIQVQYATLGEFFEALHQKNVTWDVKVEKDFVVNFSHDKYLEDFIQIFICF